MSIPEIVTHESNFHIQPNDIKVLGQSSFMTRFSTFAHASEAETTAAWIVLYAQSKKGWYPFTWEEMRKFIEEYKGKSCGPFFYISELMDEGFIQKKGEETYYVTDAFIKRCPRTQTHAEVPADLKKQQKRENRLIKFLKNL